MGDTVQEHEIFNLFIFAVFRCFHFFRSDVDFSCQVFHRHVQHVTVYGNVFADFCPCVMDFGHVVAVHPTIFDDVQDFVFLGLFGCMYGHRGHIHVFHRTSFVHCCFQFFHLFYFFSGMTTLPFSKCGGKISCACPRIAIGYGFGAGSPCASWYHTVNRWEMKIFVA